MTQGRRVPQQRCRNGGRLQISMFMAFVTVKSPTVYPDLRHNGRLSGKAQAYLVYGP